MTGRRDHARRQRARHLVGAAAGVFLALFLGAPGLAHAGEPVVVRGGLHSTFGRLVFDWRSPVSYTVAVVGDRLTIGFARPMEARFDPAIRAIPGYVRDMRLSADGRRVLVELAQPIQAGHFVNDNSVVVDLKPTGEAAPPATRVPVRVGLHDGFTRVVFDWPVRVNYRLTEQPNRISLTFDRPAVVAVPAKTVAAAPRVDDMTSARGADGNPRVEFAITGRVRHFRDGRKVVVDILSRSPVDRAAPPSAPADRHAPAPAVPARPAAPAAAEAEQADPPAGAPVQLVPPQMRAGEPAETDKLPDGVSQLDVGVKVELDGASLEFPFVKPTAMAAFRRGGWLWLVFDRPFRVDVAAIAAAEPFIAEAEQLEHAEATVLRLVTMPGFNAATAQEENRWVVTIAPQLMKPERRLKVTAHPGREATVTLAPTTPATRLSLNDPEVGDRLFVVTLPQPGEGVAHAHQFADFRLLPSAQGVAVVPYSDRLRVGTQPDRVVVTAIGGLRLAGTEAHRRVQEASRRQAAAERMFDFASWRQRELGDYRTAQHHLLARLEAAKPESRNTARLELARFYFAHGMTARARGVLELIAAQAPEMARLATFRALRGAVHYTLGDLERARKDLLDRDFDAEPEIVLWRAALAAEDGKVAEAAFGLRQSDRFVQSYPQTLQTRFVFLGAETALASGDPAGGEFWLTMLEGKPLTPGERALERVMRAQIAAAYGEFDTALDMYNDVIAGRDRRSRARAVLEKTELLLAEDGMTPEQAIEELDRLRYVWRGDDVEFRVLRRLGELQIETGAYRDGLQTLKRAVTNFADHPQAPDIAAHMRQAFRRLYRDGDIDSLPPIAAIALFNEFRELAPAGAEGDEMIRRLANRLVSVDLLEQAAELLAHQVEFRLSGTEKARVGARLAIIGLLDRDAEAALSALEASVADGLGRDLARERAVIAARAHAQLGGFDEALAMLEGFTGEPIDRLRADIMWQMRDWAGAAELFGRLAGPPPARGESLDAAHSRYVLNQAVALALAGDMRTLARLHRQFAPAMAATPYGPDFQVIASVDTAARNFQDVLRRISVADDFQAFMDGYRARLAESKTAQVDLVN